MNEMELRGNAMLSELTAQRNLALDRCALLMADIAILKDKLKELEAKMKRKEKREGKE